MLYQVNIFCPDDEAAIRSIIDAAAAAGAGVSGNYTHCATVFRGEGNFYAAENAHPVTGQAGTFNKVPDAKIEMHCPVALAKAVKAAVLKVHPYEEPIIHFIRLEEVS